MECKSFDEQVARRDPKIKDLLDQFVCARIVQANGLDLSLFQFDYDLTFAAFLMHADRTIYGRFGSRSSQKEAEKDISLEGFAAALAGALELHKAYPRDKGRLAAKRGSPASYKRPEEYPALRQYRTNLDFSGTVVKDCLHCHQVREAERKLVRGGGKPMPETVLFPWPMPDVVGLTFDPKTKGKILAVQGAAAQAGFKPGDELLTLAGQPILSIADVQWVLHNAGETASIEAQVLRKERKTSLVLALDKGWRRQAEISWRPSTWDLRRMATGGLVFEALPPAERRNLRLAEGALALRIKHVGQFGDHAAAKRAGFQKDDVLVAIGGQTKQMSETELITQLLEKKPGDRVPATVWRAGRRVNLSLPVQ